MFDEYIEFLEIRYKKECERTISAHRVILFQEEIIKQLMKDDPNFEFIAETKRGIEAEKSKWGEN